jgi:hypothetical protein
LNTLYQEVLCLQDPLSKLICRQDDLICWKPWAIEINMKILLEDFIAGWNPYFTLFWVDGDWSPKLSSLKLI